MTNDKGLRGKKERISRAREIPGEREERSV